MPNNPNHPAIEQLHRLRTGEEFVYYKGDYEKDMERSHKEAPNYARMLQGLFHEVARLHRAGKITVMKKIRAGEKEENGKRVIREYDYIATGL